MAGIIFYPLTIAHLLHHLQIKISALLKTLHLEEFILFFIFSQRQSQFGADIGHRSFEIFACGNIVAAGINGCFINRAYFLTPQRINQYH